MPNEGTCKEAAIKIVGASARAVQAGIERFGNSLAVLGSSGTCRSVSSREQVP